MKKLILALILLFSFSYHSVTEANAATINGWKLEKGQWHYYSSGKLYKGWLKSGTNWYYLDGKGVMKTGWLFWNGKWYYLSSSGAMKTGWVKDGFWYYLKPDGSMATGWIKSGNTWYYMNANGSMKTGWHYDNRYYNWYYLDSSGAMKTGWVQTSEGRYYLRSDGTRAVGWIEDNGNKYYLNKDGKMVTGWLELFQKKKYFFYPDGKMAHDTQVDGFTIGSNGIAFKQLTHEEIMSLTQNYLTSHGYPYYRLEYSSESDLISVLDDRNEEVAVLADGYVAGTPRYTRFLSDLAMVLGVPMDNSDVLKATIDELGPFYNPSYYEDEHILIILDRDNYWVHIFWGTALQNISE